MKYEGKLLGIPIYTTDNVTTDEVMLITKEQWEGALRKFAPGMFPEVVKVKAADHQHGGVQR